MLNRSSVSVQSIEWTQEQYEKIPATLMELAAKAVEGKTLTKPALIFFHAPADPSGKGLDPLAVLTSGKDLSLGMALHNAFEVFSIAVPKTTLLAGKSVPLALITDAKGQFLAEAGGKGPAPLTATALFTGMATASKALGYDLKSKVTRACSLVQGMISLEGQIKAQRENLAKIINPDHRTTAESKIADLAKRKADMEAQEKALWSELPTTKPESPAKAG